MKSLTRIQQPGASPSALISLFVRHRNAANLVMVLLIIFGAISLSRINTQFFPKIEIPVISVTVEWSGASAEDVESNILEVIEPELRYLDGVDRVTSRAREGIASIGIEYQAGVDLKEALREAETAVKAITTLPEDSETPTVRQSTRGFDRVARLALTGPVSETALRFYAKKVRDDLIERGIDKIIFSGLRTRELHVDIPERELRRLDLTVGDVSRLISANSRDLPSGQMEGEVERQLRTLANAETPRDLGKIEVRSFASGEKVRLSDIAEIREFLQLFDGFKFALHQDLVTRPQWDIGKIRQAVAALAKNADNGHVEAGTKRGMPDQLGNERRSFVDDGGRVGNLRRNHRLQHR